MTTPPKIPPTMPTMRLVLLFLEVETSLGGGKTAANAPSLQYEFGCWFFKSTEFKQFHEKFTTRFGEFETKQEGRVPLNMLFDISRKEIELPHFRVCGSCPVSLLCDKSRYWIDGRENKELGTQPDN